MEEHEVTVGTLPFIFMCTHKIGDHQIYVILYMFTKTRTGLIAKTNIVLQSGLLKGEIRDQISEY